MSSILTQYGESTRTCAEVVVASFDSATFPYTKDGEVSPRDRQIFFKLSTKTTGC